MTVEQAAAFTIMIVVAVVLLLGGIIVLGIGAQVWAKALLMVVDVRWRNRQVDALTAPQPEAEHAEPEADEDEYPKLRTGTDLSRFTGDELEAAILAGRRKTEADEEDDEFERTLRVNEVHTTDENNGFDATEPPVPGRPVVGAG